MATSLSSLLGGIYTGPSGFSGYSGAGQSGFSGYSGAGQSGFSGYSGINGGSGFSGYSGISGFSGTTFTGGTVTGAVNITNTTASTSAGSGALIVAGGVGIGGNIYVSGNIFAGNLPALAYESHILQTAVSISSTIVANLSGFSFALGTVGATYGFQFFLIYTGGTTGSALGVALTTPGFIEFAGRVQLGATVTGTAGTWGATLNTSGVKAQSVSVPAAGVVQSGIIQGTIVVSTSGVLQLQVANAVAGTTTSNVTIRRGSAGMVWRII